MPLNSSNHSENTDSLNWQVDQGSISIQGKLTISNLDNKYEELWADLQKIKTDKLIINLEKLTTIDSAGVAFLRRTEELWTDEGKSVVLTEVPENVKKTYQTFSLKKKTIPEQPVKHSFIEKIGGKLHDIIFVDFRYFIYLMADTLFWSVTDIFNHRYRRKGEFINQGVLIGANAVPIIVLISLLIGLVLALQSAAQLRQFGASIFVADLVIISMTREMGPLLTAVMLAGRSGSAIASEIGTMVVTEEVDALKTMALNPVRYLVVPKMHAMLVSLPLLTIIADCLGIFGGMIISYFYLDISPVVFYNRMSDSLIFRDILTGFVKSVIFAGLIVITGSFYGFRVKGGSEGVGRITTASVVTSIFLVILADSILGLLFYFD
jgi:phospholipid/cholesterol/gamma-HCH transport system permease protein